MSENAKYVSGLLTVIGDKEMLMTFIEMSETLELTDVAQGNISALLALADSTEAARDERYPASNWKPQ